jgi:acetyltransferase-like isoleucine patch superfamily enzyme
MRLFVGSLISFLYNSFITHVPSRRVRYLFLRFYLGRYLEGTGVQRGCRFLNGRKVMLGRRNVLNHGCLLDGRRYEIWIGDDVSIGPDATILTLGHDPQSPTFDDRGGDVTIGNRVWIGYRAVIMPRVSIGEGAVVAAGAVVTKDVEPFTIVAGVPARPIGSRNEELTYELNYHPFLN